MKESNIVRLIMLKTAGKCIAWINTRGMFLTIDGKRKVRAGIQAPGSSDLIGFKRIEITQDMVGEFCCIFLAMEIKTETGTTSHAQRDFVGFIREQGGIAGIIRSPEEALKLLNGEYNKNKDFLS